MARAGSSTLIKRISEREKFLRKVTSFVEKLVQEKGRVIRRSQGSSNTHVVAELLNFGDFSFKTDWGQTMFGGNDVEVWYHPNSNFKDRKRFNPVFSVYYQCARFETDDCKVNTFDENLTWQSAFNKMMKNKKKMLADMKKKERDTRRKDLSEAKNQDKTALLKKQAEKLGVG
ncbi:MAG: hypothetical protein A3B99_00705 [Candidatus Yanofskybacteria bacterium RIFCSPHIGHO2_02_FULL_44_12b]|uniref:Uncharacterized protein n=2 Tax=Candidatus Yanofskyibacteriota TaxID=1752733 RepID=A0A1F8GKH6_9BACT|nr:MAG: hypothetical protein UW79_C0004G0007 [Candidatus Yanofskybacteria bacterium GW2011_GWA2_44_9]OGN05351.1 MAG: hypothetical protein A2659_01995 [Candidatus Yanofskybacteria bacterium RIFCSPHIGHO2_01_FULL_44_24]OGN15999.1 MAG: hypothetical protein A3B99_00705 [Candidatus Yanofskybacteria bacterium RIFCSPHIGHO2_02_FULL_44_12b]OGN25510.1 MAG: hypothetical protein A2925_02150 [Candidatus Yanofskybacteria bacterium RIFCSPLOWO2_01_FULL_44_22]